jgi:hypothetical protein
VTPARTARLAASVVLAGSAVSVLPAAPAAAATCSSSSGVSVVVDFSLVGGGVAATCVAGGGGDTAGALLEVDHDLTRVAQFPGAVCKVDGAPGDAQCQRMPPTDAYWGLFWSDGSGGWVYSSEGVDNLNVPDGGSVAMAWQDGGERDQPGIAPPQHASEEPSPSPTPDGDDGDGDDDDGEPGGGDQQGGAPGPSPSASTSPSASPSGSASPGARPGGKRDREDRDDRKQRRDRGGKASDAGGDAEESATPEADPSDAVPAGAEPPAGAGEDGLPAWVAPVGIAALFGVAGVVALLRRRAAS